MIPSRLTTWEQLSFFATIFVLILVCNVCIADQSLELVKAHPEKAAKLPHCVTQQEQREIRGQSMKGLLKAGDQILVLHNYYDCSPVERGDWLVFRYSGTLGKNLAIIKLAAGLPGDQLGSELVEGLDISAIKINGNRVISPDGKPYYLNDVGASYLGLALRQARNGVIPRGRYWVLGTSYTDGWDSRRFGFIPHRDLMGKAVPLK